MPALLRVVFRNWPLKLAALLLSAILWVIVSAEETTSALVVAQLEVAVPPTLALTGPPPELRVVPLDLDAIRALVAGLPLAA